jgi:hypothetical protein
LHVFIGGLFLHRPEKRVIRGGPRLKLLLVKDHLVLFIAHLMFRKLLLGFRRHRILILMHFAANRVNNGAVFIAEKHLIIIWVSIIRFGRVSTLGLVALAEQPL